MADDDWFRAERWSAAHAEQFEARLARARADGRAQYLRIQGYSLTKSKRASDRRIARSLLRRALELGSAEDTRDPVSVIDAHVDLADLARTEGDAAGEAEHLRAAIDAEEGYGGRVRTGAPLQLARLIAEQRWEDRYDEADGLLQGVLDHGMTLFRDQQFAYAVARMRIARDRGDHDLAAAYAEGAKALLDDNRPMAPRHPTVGLIRRASADERELRGITAAGVAERGAPVIDAFRDDEGEVRWGWDLVARLHETGDAAARAVADRGGEEAAELLAALRSAGVELYELYELRSFTPASTAQARAVAPILIEAYENSDDMEVRAAIAWALVDRRFRSTAVNHVIRWYADLAGDDLAEPGPPATEETAARLWLSEALSQAVGRLADHRHRAQLVALLEDPRHGIMRCWLIAALVRSKGDAVDDLLRLVADPVLEGMVLRGLSTLRTARAEPLFAEIAARPRPRGWINDPDEDQREAALIDIAREALERIAEARAKGTLLP